MCFYMYTWYYVNTGLGDGLVHWEASQYLNPRGFLPEMNKIQWFCLVLIDLYRFIEAFGHKIWL